jgi:DNA-binding NtrC family response regulator
MHTRWEALILSTDLEWRRTLARILTANGIDFAYASNLEDCKEIVARECVGMIFWDSHLANGSYYELAFSVQSLDPRVKIVVISHTDDWNEQLATAQIGAFGVIPYPCQPTDIEWVLSRAIRAELEETKSKSSQAWADSGRRKLEVVRNI